MLHFIGIAAAKFMLFPKWLRVSLEAAIALSILLGLGIHLYHNAIKAAEKRGSDAAYASIEKQANALAKKAEALAQNIRRHNDEEAHAIGDRADAVQLRGPGKASCSGAIASSPIGSNSVGGSAVAPVAGMSGSERIDLIGLPFAPAVSGAKVCDLNRNEVLGWREWYAKLVKAWPQPGIKAAK